MRVILLILVSQCCIYVVSAGVCSVGTGQYQQSHTHPGASGATIVDITMEADITNSQLGVIDLAAAADVIVQVDHSMSSAIGSLGVTKVSNGNTIAVDIIYVENVSAGSSRSSPMLMLLLVLPCLLFGLTGKRSLLIIVGLVCITVVLAAPRPSCIDANITLHLPPSVTSICINSVCTPRTGFTAPPPTMVPTPAPTPMITVVGPTSMPLVVPSSEFTYPLLGRSDFWTACATYRVKTGDLAPAGTARNDIEIWAAKGEFEPFQVVLNPGTGSVAVTMQSFSTLGGTGARIDMFEAAYQGGFAEVLTTLSSPVSLSSTVPTVLWFDVYVPSDAVGGLHTATLDVAGTSVTIKLFVFNFDISTSRNFRTQMNFGISQPEQPMKEWLWEHRWSTKSNTWPSGFKWSISWENTGKSGQRTACTPPLWDEPDEGAQFAVGELSKKYILGTGWTGGPWTNQGFPSNMLFQFVSNSQPRPDPFCGISIGSGHYGTPAYNAEWQEWLGELQTYLTANGMLSKSYAYVQNEPQTAADDALAAHLCRIYKAGAPNLKIAISEEPKASIAEDAGGACGYDIWIAHLTAVDNAKTYAHQRIQNNGEEWWLYTLPQDASPWWRPQGDHEGPEVRAITWSSWALRATGYAYYNSGTWIHNGVPGIRAKLFRESFEDYEYMLLANGGVTPRPNTVENADATVLSISTGINSWQKDENAYHTIKRELGRYIDGTITTLPVFTAASSRPRGDYYINFQGTNPAGPLMHSSGETYIQVSPMTYDPMLGYGFVGQHADPLNTGRFLTGYNTAASSEVDRSYVYDDYGRKFIFQFDITPGLYDITCMIGDPNRARAGDPHNLVIEGVQVATDWVSPGPSPFIQSFTASNVMVNDAQINIEFSGKTQAGAFAYTFAEWCSVIAVP